MDLILRQCDGCETPIQLQNETNGIYHSIHLDFSTTITDQNTGMTEEIPTMKRQTSAIYCDACFHKFVDHMENFLQDIGPQYKKVSQVEVTGKAKEINDEAKKAVKAKQNFKAKIGTEIINIKEKKNVSKH